MFETVRPVYSLLAPALIAPYASSLYACVFGYFLVHLTERKAANHLHCFKLG
jgi:hypothetical protein